MLKDENFQRWTVGQEIDELLSIGKRRNVCGGHIIEEDNFQLCQLATRNV